MSEPAKKLCFNLLSSLTLNLYILEFHRLDFIPLRRYGISTFRGYQQHLRDCSTTFFELLPFWLKHRENVV